MTPLRPYRKLTTDRILLERLAVGDRTARRELERRYLKTAYALAYGLLLDSRAAERVVAEAFEQVVRLSGLIPGSDASFPATLSQIVKSRALQFLAAFRPGRVQSLVATGGKL